MAKSSHLLPLAPAEQLIQGGQLADLPDHFCDLAAEGVLNVRNVHECVIRHIMQQCYLQSLLNPGGTQGGGYSGYSMS